MPHDRPLPTPTIGLLLLLMPKNAAAAMQPTRTILVTGATEGIGLETAKQLSKQGHTVLVHGRNSKKVEGVVKALGSGDHRGYVADLSSMADVRALGAQVSAAHPVLDGLLNNAGSFDGDYSGKKVVTAEG